MTAADRSDAAAVLDVLLEGNQRFVAGEVRPVDTIDVGKPNPVAAVITCSDPRVSPSVLLQQPVGALFEVRNAGAVPTPSAIASLALGIGLGARVVVVAGHEDCAALNRACALERDGAATPVAEAPAVGPLREVLDPRDVDDADRALPGVVMAWAERVAAGPGVVEPVNAGEVTVVGAVVELPSGRLRLIGGNEKAGGAVDLDNVRTFERAD